MKTHLFYLVLLSFFLIHSSNAQELEWAVAAQGVDEEGASAVHSHGKYIYVAGRSDGDAPTSFGPIPLRSNTVNGSNYLAKYTQAGVLSWVKAMTTPSTAKLQINGIDTDAAGNVYIIGELGMQDFTFGPGEANETTISSGLSASPVDVFVAKYNSSGDFQWGKTGWQCRFY